MSGMNILTPLAGAGKSFRDKGSIFPKPLVEVSGRPMIQVVVENLATMNPERFVFVVNRDDTEQFALTDVLHMIARGSEVIVAPGATAGAACTALLAAQHIDNDTPLVIANGDQYIDTDLSGFVEDAIARDLDGSMITFPSVHPKWSFARSGDDGLVVETAEKRPISDQATVGVYYFRQGRDFVKACRRMIRKDARVLDQFFICPAYNELILDGARIGTYPVGPEEMYPLTTSAEIEVFVQHKMGDCHAKHRDSRGRRRLTLRPGRV